MLATTYTVMASITVIGVILFCVNCSPPIGIERFSTVLMYRKVNNGAHTSSWTRIYWFVINWSVHWSIRAYKKWRCVRESNSYRVNPTLLQRAPYPIPVTAPNLPVSELSLWRAFNYVSLPRSTISWLKWILPNLKTYLMFRLSPAVQWW